MIVLFTDFGLEGPYTGQMKAALHARAPGVPVIDLFADAPTQNPKAAAYLLAAYAQEFHSGAVFLCVVDPGVGGSRAPAIAEADGRIFVGPRNGLFELVLRRATWRALWRIGWKPARLSTSFHGRDLFAPVAADIAMGRPIERSPLPWKKSDWPDDLAEVIYVDRYGNAMTGWRASKTSAKTAVNIGDNKLRRAGTFSSVKPGQAFWYENSNGLVEISVNRGRACDLLGLEVGMKLRITP